MNYGKRYVITRVMLMGTTLIFDLMYSLKAPVVPTNKGHGRSRTHATVLPPRYIGQRGHTTEEPYPMPYAKRVGISHTVCTLSSRVSCIHGGSITRISLFFTMFGDVDIVFM
jgi:hypothetical protein